MPINSHKDLIVWHKAIALSKEVYLLTDNYPKEELFGLTAQMRRSAVSIPSNIAEGRSRNTRKDFIQFLHIALGSASELETQIEIAKQLPKTQKFSYKNVDILVNEVSKMIMGMIKKLKLAPRS